MTTPIIPGSPEHDAAMIAHAENSNVRIRVSDAQTGESHELLAKDLSTGAEITATPPAGTVEPKPEHVPAKFYDALTGKVDYAALAKSYTELERARTLPPVARPGEKPAAAPVAAPVVPSAAQVAAQAELTVATTDEAKVAAQANLDAANAAAAPPPVTPDLQAAMDVAAEDYAKAGVISDAGYAALAAAGINKGTADRYVSGLKAEAELVTMKVYNAAGGEAEYTKMAQWVVANWNADQIAAHNAAIHGGVFDTTIGAVTSLRAAYTAAQGTSPTARVEQEGGGGNAILTEMYNNANEMSADMNNPLYTRGDKAFHSMVDRKLSASIKNNVNLGF